MRATELLAKLVDAGDPTTVAREHVESLNEEFFMSASAYLGLAKKEGSSASAEVVPRLERALAAAWTVKQSTLRPELQLLNTLVRTDAPQQRAQMYVSGGSELADTLVMNNRWFFSTLDRLARDVEAQPSNPGKAPLLGKLRAIQKETEAIARQHASRRGDGAA